MSSIFSPISRLPFVLRTVALLALAAVAVYVSRNERNVLAGCVILGAVAAILLQGIKRARGAGHSGLWGLLLVVPWVNVAAWITLALMPSKPLAEG